MDCNVAGSASPYLSPKDHAQVVDDQRVVGNLVAWDHMEVRGNKCNRYTQDLLELDSYVPVVSQVANKMLAKVKCHCR